MSLLQVQNATETMIGAYKEFQGHPGAEHKFWKVKKAESHRTTLYIFLYHVHQYIDIMLQKNVFPT